jgi:hypothetical protein
MEIFEKYSRKYASTKDIIYGKIREHELRKNILLIFVFPNKRIHHAFFVERIRLWNQLHKE